MQSALEESIMATRWLLAVFLLGLGVALALYAVRFAWKLVKLAEQLFQPDDNVFLLGVLHLLDAALVASLVVMVMISSWDSYVSKLTDEDGVSKFAWAGKIDATNLKLKLATAIIAISSIHLLQIFMRVGSYSDRDIMWAFSLHAMFIGGGLILAVMDRLGIKDSKG